MRGDSATRVTTIDSCLHFLRDAAVRGERTVLVTIVGIEGSASRAMGTHLAVSEGGDWFGSLAGGCIEAAVAAEALRVLTRGKAEIVRFGTGSPYIDIRLPCGGGLDLLFTPDPQHATIDDACDFIARRKAFTLRLDSDAMFAIDAAEAATGWAGHVFSVRHHPVLRIVIAGQGEEAAKAVALALAYGAETCLWTPDRALAKRAATQGATAHWLKTPAQAAEIVTDRYTAMLLLFHEHDWETEFLIAALRHPGFFIGAMGSPKTHAARLDGLRQRGVAEQDLARITGPVGSILATRDPATLALSALAQIVARYREFVERGCAG